jgi:hypothetical protein
MTTKEQLQAALEALDNICVWANTGFTGSVKDCEYINYRKNIIKAALTAQLEAPAAINLDETREQSSDIVGKHFTAVENGKYKHIKSCAEKWMKQIDEAPAEDAVMEAAKMLDGWFDGRMNDCVNSIEDFSPQLYNAAQCVIRNATAMPEVVKANVLEVAICENFKNSPAWHVVLWLQKKYPNGVKVEGV